MIRFRTLQDNEFYPAKLMKMFNISLDEWEFISMATDREWLAGCAAKRGAGSLCHRALCGYDAIKSLELQLASK